jgi:hypothetical protein
MLTRVQVALVLLIGTVAGLVSDWPIAAHSSPAVSGVTLAHFTRLIRDKANAREKDAAMRLSFTSFTTASRIQPERVSYSDFVVVRLSQVQCVEPENDLRVHASGCPRLV